MTVGAEAKFFYANGSEVAASAFDVGIRFLHNTPDVSVGPNENMQPVKSKLSTVDSIWVSMSPAHLKAMVPALIDLVRSHEENFGHISVAPEIQIRWEMLVGKKG